ncbi:hypothetical protein WK25_15890 [Burkholderia latens]|nr:hypothetical protein WK25_15890 [Burkholderia latens]
MAFLVDDRAGSAQRRAAQQTNKERVMRHIKRAVLSSLAVAVLAGFAMPVSAEEFECNSDQCMTMECYGGVCWWVPRGG